MFDDLFYPGMIMKLTSNFLEDLLSLLHQWLSVILPVHVIHVNESIGSLCRTHISWRSANSYNSNFYPLLVTL